MKKALFFCIIISVISVVSCLSISAKAGSVADLINSIVELVNISVNGGIKTCGKQNSHLASFKFRLDSESFVSFSCANGYTATWNGKNE